MLHKLVFAYLIDGCEDGWSRLNDGCYKVFPDKKNWTLAEDFCNRAGGHLASAHSKEETGFIQQLDNSSDDILWIGGIRDGNVFKWIDGTPFDFDHWGPTEPNNLGGNENCMHLFTNQEMSVYNTFNDIECDRKASFICKKLSKGGM